jgi:hypothetical protein
MKALCHLCKREFKLKADGRFFKHGFTNEHRMKCCIMSHRNPMVVPSPGEHVNIKRDQGPLFDKIHSVMLGTYVGEIVGGGPKFHYCIWIDEYYGQPRAGILYPHGDWKIVG